MIEKGKSIPYIWVVFVILICIAIHVFQKITGAMVLCGKVKGIMDIKKVICYNTNQKRYKKSEGT